MKRYGLLKCFPAGFYGQSGNICLAETEAESEAKALEVLQPKCPAPLNNNGYAKVGTITYVVGEFIQ